MQVRPVHKSKLWELLWQKFYMTDSIPVTQPTALKDDSVPSWGQHAAKIGQEH